MRRHLFTALLAGLALLLTVITPASASPVGGKNGGQAGTVFVATNHNNTADPSEPSNQVAMYRRAANGGLTLIGYFDTGGQGSGPSQRFAGDGLGSGSSVLLSQDHRWLFVTNAGSDSVSVFRVHRDRLELTDVAATGDGSPDHRFPNSVAQYGDLVYVLNSADNGSITGFRLSNKGKLTPVAGSTRGLEGNQDRFAPDPLFNPTQISFTPDGSQLVVTIKDGPAEGLIPDVTPTGPGRILVWNMKSSGVPSADFTRTDLDNRGPFGFSFDRRGNLLVALFIGGGPEVIDGVETLGGGAGSYRIEADGSLTAITELARDHQVDTCWLVNNGRYAFGANYTSGTISSFEVRSDGSLTLLDSVAGTTDDPGNVQGSTPLDMAVSGNGRFLYVVLPGSGKVGGWRIDQDGTLTKVGEFGGLPQTVDGDQAPFDFGPGGSPAGIAAT